MRGVPLVAVLGDAHGAVALAQLLAVRREHHGKVREGGERVAEGLVEHDLRGRVDHVVAPASDERDAHGDVVDDGAEVVERDAVAAEEHEVLLGGVRRRDGAEDLVDVGDAAGLGRAEADDEREIRLVLPVAAGARVTEGGLRVLRLEGGALRVELLLSAVAAVGLALRDEPLAPLLVEAEPLHLRVRPEGAAFAGPLVPGEAEPLERVEDDAQALRGASLLIGVLDAQHEHAARLARPEPVEERRPDAADVEIPGGRRREADALDHGRAK